MHPRNIYSEPIDFDKLSESYPPLSKKLIRKSNGSTSLDFQDAESQRSPITDLRGKQFARLNYILWLQDLQLSLWRDEPELASPGEVKVIDIGTGASVIYPFLGCATDPNWSFIATEKDEQSLRSARENILSNKANFGERIELYPIIDGDAILQPLFADTQLHVDFTMCNPPFYASREEIESSEAFKFEPASAVCTGSENEMITPGGELEFVKQMIEESVSIGERCRWYTSMIGKYADVGVLCHALKERKIDNYALHRLDQGQTYRWVIGWSFGSLRVDDECARFASSGSSLSNVMPEPNSADAPLLPNDNAFQNLDDLIIALESIISDIAGASQRRDGHKIVVRLPEENTWNRSARRKKRRKLMLDSENPRQPDEQTRKGEMIVALEVCGIEEVTDADGRWRLRGRWLKGRDRDLWESFFGYVRRRLSTQHSD